MGIMYVLSGCLDVGFHAGSVDLVFDSVEGELLAEEEEELLCEECVQEGVVVEDGEVLFVGYGCWGDFLSVGFVSYGF